MVELLVILALIGWVGVSLVEFLSSLAAFPTIVAAAITVPLVMAGSYANLLRGYGLEFLRTNRRFLPPERFYWPGQRRRLVLGMGIFFLASATAWPLAILLPASLRMDGSSISGWFSGLVAIFASGCFLSRFGLFLKASQRYDSLTPGAIGALRRWMFRISDNYEFLGEEPEIPKKSAKEAVC